MKRRPSAQSLRKWLVLVAGDRRCHEPGFREHIASIQDSEKKAVRVPCSLRATFGAMIPGSELTTFSGRMKRIHWEPEL